MDDENFFPLSEQNGGMSALDDDIIFQNDDFHTFGDGQLYNDENSFSDNSVSESAQKFPNLIVCLPKWKMVFPWLEWHDNSNIFSCRLCSAITVKYFPEDAKLAEVIKINSPSDVFNVAKKLRNHSESLAHCVSWCFSVPNSLHSFTSVTGNLFLECKTIEDALDLVKVIFCDKQFKMETFIKAIKSIANCMEQNIIDMVKTCTYFSVVADQCRGLIILRIVEHKVRIEEHILWSYVTVYDQTPMKYLELCGLDMNKLIIYIANTPCQQCSRCAKSVSSRAKLPPRAPSVRYFSCLLWQEEAFRPLFIVINQIVKLWKLFPFIFVKRLPQFNFRYLLSFYYNPTAVLPVFENFEAFRQIFLEIYEKQHLLQCLGLYHTKLINEEPQKKFLTILQEILDILSITGKSRVITNEQILKLSQALFSLKMNAKGLKFIINDGVAAADDAANDRRLSDSVFDLVEKFIDENKKALYYCGKECLPAYFNLFNIDYLKNRNGSLNIDRLTSTLNTVNDSFANLIFGKDKDACDSVIKFYQEIIRCRIKTETCIDMVDLFWKFPSYQNKYYTAYKLSLLVSVLPFQPCRLRKQIFSAFVVEQKYEHSFWNKLDADLKPWLLYIHDEMPFTHTKILFSWWKKIASS